MEIRKHKGELSALTIAVTVLAFTFIIMPSVLASATASSSDMQTVTVDTTALKENTVTDHSQTLDINAISEDQAIINAMTALESLGFETDDFENQPVEIRYVPENAPAGNPIWAVIFRDDQEGYVTAFGDEVNDEIREKIAAVGKVEECTDKNGIPGIRAHYSYTRYTLVEINALSGEYIRHGESVVEIGKPLKIEETYWAPTTEEAWEWERQRQEQLERESE